MRSLTDFLQWAVIIMNGLSIILLQLQINRNR